MHTTIKAALNRKLNRQHTRVAFFQAGSTQYHAVCKPDRRVVQFTIATMTMIFHNP